MVEPPQIVLASQLPSLLPPFHAALLGFQLLSLFLHIDANVNIIATAALTVFVGCWRSVKEAPPTETMTKKDAMRFPLVGSCVLFSLFLLFKFLPKELVNAMLTAYLGIFAIIVLTSVVEPFLVPYVPARLSANSIRLPAIKIPQLFDNTDPLDPAMTSYLQISLGTCSCGFFLWYCLTKHWLANNVLALSFALEGIEQLSLGSFHVGAILLVGLFFYDIFWVFCTPVMVTVAKNFDAPIKLLFPREGALLASGARPFAMLGLGDIVIPGIFVALMLRYDASRKFESRYFHSAFGGYVLGLVSTIVVMNWFEAAQPALLYIVPCVLGAVLLHAALKRELAAVFAYSEGSAKEEAEAAAAAAPAVAGADAASAPVVVKAEVKKAL